VPGARLLGVRTLTTKDSSELRPSTTIPFNLARCKYPIGYRDWWRVGAPLPEGGRVRVALRVTVTVLSLVSPPFTAGNQTRPLFIGSTIVTWHCEEMFETDSGKF
jgi:hypothetical protein